MPGLKRRDWAHSRAARLLGTVAIFALGTPHGYAQSASAAQAEAPATYNFKIPAKSLASAIADVGAISGWRIAYPFTLPSNITSAPLSGTMTPSQAIAQLLAGTGLNYRVSGPQSIVLVSSAQQSAGGESVPGAISLDTINVQGDQQSPTGPGVGYIATRSLAGSKTDTPIIETPQSISVVTRQQMDDQQPENVGQALAYTSGTVSQSEGTSNGDDVIYLRGFGGFGNEYLNGLRLLHGGLSYPQFDPYGLTRIEVLKGPASVLYGQNDPGGVVNLVSKMPTANPLHEVFFQTGSYGRLEGGFDLGGPIDKDGQFLYRLTGLGLSTDTQTEFIKNQRIFIAPAVTWKPEANTTLTVLTSYQRDPIFGLAATTPAQGAVLFNPNGKFPSNFYDGDPNFATSADTRYSIGYQFEHRFDDTWTVRQNFRYLHSDLNNGYVFNTGFEPDLTTLDRVAYMGIDHLDGITLDNQAQAKFGTGPLRHTVLFGVDYQHSWDTGQQYIGSAPSLNAFNPVYYQPIPTPTTSIGDSKQQLDQVGLYAQDQMRFGKWAFLLGGREDWASLSTDDLNADTNTTQLDRAFTGRAGIVYLFDNGLAPYVSYSTSFLPTTGTDFGGNPFKPTTGQQEEVGIKYQLPNSNTFITASAFNLTEQNVLTNDPEHPEFNIQTGEIRSRGIELEGKTSLTEGLDVTASYTYLNAINTKSNTTDTTINGITESTQGKQPVAIPSQSASLWANYTFHEGDVKGLSVGGGARYVGWTYGDDVNSFKVPAVTLFDAATGYDFGQASRTLKGLRVQVNATNIFDKAYTASCVGSFTCYIGLRRTVLATLKYDW